MCFASHQSAQNLSCGPSIISTESNHLLLAHPNFRSVADATRGGRLFGATASSDVINGEYDDDESKDNESKMADSCAYTRQLHA